MATFSLSFFFFHAPILEEQEFILSHSHTLSLLFFLLFLQKDFSLERKHGWRVYFVDNDDMDMVDDMDAIFQSISLAYVCICGCMILIIEHEKYLHKLQEFDKVQ
jgi:hypothetical protein